MLLLRRRSLGFVIFIFVVLAVSCYYFLYLFEPFPNDLKEYVEEVTSQDSHVDLPVLPHNTTTNHSLCEPDECTRGSWFLRQPPFRSIADFRREYPKTHYGAFKICGSDENKRDEEDRARFHEAQVERLVQANNWVWRPFNGRMHEWNAIEFAIRLLRSPGGLIFCGDSITRQHAQWFTYALSRADIRLVENPSHLPLHSQKHLRQYVLKPGDYMTEYLQDRAGVPEARLKSPLYTYIENFILIGEREVREITVPLGAKESFPWRDIFNYFEGWEDFVRDASMFRGEQNVTENTILLLNTGAHWSRGSFSMLPNTGKIKDQQSRLTEAYKKMVGLIKSRLDPIPHLSIFYRPTPPAHPACASSMFYQSFRVNSTVVAENGDNNAHYRPFTESSNLYTLPYPNSTVARKLMTSDSIQLAVSNSTMDENMRTARLRWDWDLFERHNGEWKRMIEDKRDRESLEMPAVGAQWHYMDIWEMALQRPDAHTQNLVDPAHDNYDCLHWCVPGVVEQWLQLLNHIVFWNKDGN